MKKLKWALFLPLLFVLVACGTKPKEEFVTRLKNASEAKQVGYDYSIKINDLTMSKDAEEAAFDVSEFTDKSFDMTVQQDMEAGLVGLTMDLSQISKEMGKLELIYTDDKAYMSADLLMTYAGLDDTSKFEGKYLDLAEYTGEEIPSLSDAVTQAGEADYSWISKLPDENFTEKDGKITAKFTMDDLFEMVSKSSEKQDLDAKTKEEMQTYLDMAKAALSDKSEVTMTIDKEGNGSAVINLVLAAGADSGVKSLELQMDFKQITYKAPKAPAKSDIISQEDVESLVVESYKLSDAEFQEIYDEIEADLDYYTQEDLKEMITSMEDYLTDAQIKKLEELAKKASKSAA